MGLRIASNLTSLSIARNLVGSSESLSKTYQRVATGRRIISSADDAAGLAISETLRASVRSTAQAERNANDGLSFIQVAEGSMTEIGNILIRLRELGVQAASDTIGDREREYINQEAQSLVQEIDRIANSTTYQNLTLLNGEGDKGVVEIQVGIRSDENDRIVYDTANMDVRASVLGLEGLDYESVDGAREALDVVDEGMSRFFGIRASVGALQNRLESAARNAGVDKDNLAIAHARIADADLALETAEMVRKSVVQSSAVSVLAQANSIPALALKLL